MEPASILELTVTVLELSWKLYKFFKSIRDAPEEIVEYLAVLETVRRAFQDVQEYAEMYQRSRYVMEDGLCLKVVEQALKDCELEFALQLSLVENMKPNLASSFFTKSWDQARWVLKKETIEGLTRKLEKLQNLLGLAVTTSSGKNDILMREKLEVVSSEVHRVRNTYEAEAADRRLFLLRIQQYMTELQRGTSAYLQLAQEANIRSDARLGDLANSLAADLKVDIDVELEQKIENPLDPGSISQDEHLEGLNKETPLGDGHLEAGQTQLEEILTPKRGAPQPAQPSGQAETLGCRPAIEEAFMRFKMSHKDSDLLKGAQGMPEVQDLMSRLGQKPAPLSRRISRITSSLVGWSNTLDIIGQRSPALSSVVWGSVKVLLSTSVKYTSVLLDGMTEMSDAITSCERELVLYKDPKLYSLVESAYFELLQALSLAKQNHIGSGHSGLIQFGRPEFTTKFDKSIAEIRRLSQAVQREVDYHHRLEMRETSSRIVDMQLEQRKMLATLEDQRRILKSLEEERKIMNVVREQQKILQIVQQIQGAMQAKATQEASI